MRENSKPSGIQISATAVAVVVIAAVLVYFFGVSG